MNNKLKYITILAASAILSGCAVQKAPAGTMSIDEATIKGKENCIANHTHENDIEKAYCILDFVEANVKTKKGIQIAEGPGLQFEERKR